MSRQGEWETRVTRGEGKRCGVKGPDVDRAEPAVQVHRSWLPGAVTKHLTQAAEKREGLLCLVVSEGFQSAIEGT